jgi:hypothetical protein
MLQKPSPPRSPTTGVSPVSGFSPSAALSAPGLPARGFSDLGIVMLTRRRDRLHEGTDDGGALLCGQVARISQQALGRRMSGSASATTACMCGTC